MIESNYRLNQLLGIFSQIFRVSRQNPRQYFK